MTPLEAKITALLVDCEALLEPVNVTGQKWVVISDTEQQLRTLQDEKASLAYAWGSAHQKISELESYAEAKSAFERDKIFSEAKRGAGYWATFEAVIQYLISCSGRSHRTGVKLDHAKAIRCLRSLREDLTRRHLTYQAFARLLGVNLRSKSLSLPDGVTLYRLSRKERNERQPLLQPYIPYGWEEQQLASHPSELRVSITVPVDHSQEGAFFNANNNAQRVAHKIFTKMVHAILIASSGTVRLGPIDLEGGLEQLRVGRSISKEIVPVINVVLGKRDPTNISTTYALVSGGRIGDKTLSRALHRFVLGRQRSDLIDKLVDFVIAWEAILLTQDGNPITQELSYRFGLNGASIIRSAVKHPDPRETYKQMKSAYSTRSTVVHGGGDKDRDKALRSGGFNNLQELCEFLEGNFRRVVFWLALLKPKDRPYRKCEGWENLLWSKP